METSSSPLPPPDVVSADYPEGSVGRLMEPPTIVFHPHVTVAEATETVRALAADTRIFTYGYVVDVHGTLLGAITLRDLLLNAKTDRVEDFMLRQPFALRPELPLRDAMRLTLNKHFASYPVCDPDGKLVGVARGSRMFEQERVELSAQAGRMVGVEKDERVTTSLGRSLRSRHPSLQANLVGALVAAGVASLFADALGRIVALAVFLPVFASQSGLTGGQALAAALRAMTLGELKPGIVPRFVVKEAALGLCHGLLVGVVAGLAMYVYALSQSTPVPPLRLATVVFLALTAACFVSGVAGALVPLTLKKFGANPAKASSIFLTTLTGIASTGCLLGLATRWLR